MLQSQELPSVPSVSVVFHSLFSSHDSLVTAVVVRRNFKTSNYGPTADHRAAKIKNSKDGPQILRAAFDLRRFHDSSSQLLILQRSSYPPTFTEILYCCLSPERQPLFVVQQQCNQSEAAKNQDGGEVDVKLGTPFGVKICGPTCLCYGHCKLSQYRRPTTVR
jgi:hypothetical protein